MARTRSANVHKKTVVERVAVTTATSTAVARKVVDAFMTEIQDELARGNRLEFRGFGVFQAADYKDREAKDPRTGRTMRIPARKIVKFKMGKLLRKALNGDKKR